MFPRSERPSGHQGQYNRSVTRSPASTRFYFNQQTHQTRINGRGPESLPVYQWEPTSIPDTSGPPGASSRKRQYSADRPHPYAKRQRAESFHSDELFPSFESPPLPQIQCPPHQAAARVSHDTTPNIYEYSRPRPHTPHVSPETPISLQSYVNDKVGAQMVELFQACQQQSSDLYQKEAYRARLQKDIQRLFPDARLYLTGSTLSGLGCRSSDADLCLVIRLRKHYDNVIKALSTILKLLRTLAYVDRVMLIRAKVPILRFKEKGSALEFDLNVNNTVGIRNTFLLRSYTHADIRIRPLMLVIKKWARHCEINDASKGTLSSYALALMALNYLQIVNPPVLPSLQRDHPGHFAPFLDLDMVPDGSQRVPCYKSENEASLGELFLGFLKYYALAFRWDSQIISVRLARTLPKTNSPDWRGKFICIEEPFERHNVARAVYEKAKFDTIKAKFVESFRILHDKEDLESLLPLEAIIQKEQTVR